MIHPVKVQLCLYVFSSYICIYLWVTTSEVYWFRPVSSLDLYQRWGSSPSLAHTTQSPPGSISILCRFTLLQRQPAPTHLSFDFSECMAYSFSMSLLFIFIEAELPYTITVSFRGYSSAFFLMDYKVIMKYWLYSLCYVLYTCILIYT